MDHRWPEEHDQEKGGGVQGIRAEPQMEKVRQGDKTDIGLQKEDLQYQTKGEIGKGR